MWIAAYSPEGALQMVTKVAGATPFGFIFEFGRGNKPGITLTGRGNLAIAAGPYTSSVDGFTLFNSAGLGLQPVPSGLPPVVPNTPFDTSNILILQYTTEGQALWGASFGPADPDLFAVLGVGQPLLRVLHRMQLHNDHQLAVILSAAAVFMTAVVGCWQKLRCQSVGHAWLAASGPEPTLRGDWVLCCPLQISPVEPPFQNFKLPGDNKSKDSKFKAQAATGDVYFGTTGALQSGLTVMTAFPAATATGAVPRTANNQGSVDAYYGRYDSRGAPLWLAHVGGSGLDFGGFVTTNTQGRPVVVSDGPLLMYVCATLQ
jgi:hypothetical protein